MTAYPLRKKINPQDPAPAYQQIAEVIRDAIREDDLELGDPIPSRADLREHFGAANATVARAIETLQNEGILYGRQGAGVYVSQGALDVLANQDATRNVERQTESDLRQEMKLLNDRVARLEQRLDELTKEG